MRLPGLSEEVTNDLLPRNYAILGYRGSIAHGMYVPQENPDSIDDKDIMGVFIGPREHYLGFGRADVHEAFFGCWDIVEYELRKFVGLLLKCNPNVLSMLWLDEKHYIHVSSAGRTLIDNRNLFTSKAAYHSFSGYAHSQFKRMTHLAFEGYMGDKRKRLVEKHGYDTKNAAHLVRLLKMGIEFLNEGELFVERKDAAELLAIKRGEWSLDEVKDRANGLFRLAEEAYVRSPLPDKPDRNKVEALMMSIIAENVGLG